MQQRADPLTLCSRPAGDPLSIIDHIHERKMKAGVAISPDTPSTAVTDEIAEAADMLLVMTVYPGSCVTPSGAQWCIADCALYRPRRTEVPGALRA